MGFEGLHISRTCFPDDWNQSKDTSEQMGSFSHSLITKTCPCNFNAVKFENFQLKNVIFNIFAQNIDCGYTLEPPRQAVLTSTNNLCFGAKNQKNRYTPAFPSFAI